MRLSQSISKVDTTKKCNEKSGTILLADDEVSSILLEELLKEHSYEILNAINGHETVDLCHNHSEIDLVLMDIRILVSQ